MGVENQKPVIKDTAEQYAPVEKASSARTVSDQDMERYSSKMVELRGIDPNPSSVPQLGFFDSTQSGGNRPDSRDSNPSSLRPSSDLNSPLSSDPIERAHQLLRRSTKTLEKVTSDPVSRAQDLFQRMEPYKAPDGTTRLRPRQEGPQRPGELPPQLAKELRQLTDDMKMHPPSDVNKLPSPEDQARLKEQAKYIAGVIGTSGDFNSGDNRAKLDSMFESATKGGEDHLNFLVKQVNDQLKKSHPDLQLEYSFDTKSAWYSKDTHGAAVYYQPQEVKENHSTVGLSRTSAQQNLISSKIEDKINSVGSLKPPGYVRSGDPHSKLILD